jgi:ornithine decarboxylase
VAQIRFRSTVTPLRRGGAVPLRRGGAVVKPRRVSVDTHVAEHRPADPVHCLRPAVLSAAAACFVRSFPGDVLYAVKCNPEPAALRALWAGGVRHFDAASPAEIRTVRQLFPQAEVHYMHPVKARRDIRTAYRHYGVRDFSLDSLDELTKLVEETGGADLGLMIRLAMPKGGAVYDLSGKFGATADEAVALLQAARRIGSRVGLCFHVGSQCVEPGAYERALDLAGTVLARSGVAIDILDIGGGFPVSYPGVTPPPLSAFMAAIARGVARLDLPAHCRLWCEPGRALVAPGGSLVVQVLKRRGTELFINDGVYGGLSDAGALGFRFPARLVRPEGDSAAPERAFSFWGPTCDSADVMAGPFLLPDDIGEGDWIELGQLGAYSSTLRTGFNGFDQASLIEVVDGPLLDTPGYGPAPADARAA